MILNIISNIFILIHRWESIGTTTPGQSGPGSNSNEGYSTLP